MSFHVPYQNNSRAEKADGQTELRVGLRYFMQRNKTVSPLSSDLTLVSPS